MLVPTFKQAKICFYFHSSKYPHYKSFESCVRGAWGCIIVPRGSLLGTRFFALAEDFIEV